jgi:hypothetical protein
LAPVNAPYVDNSQPSGTISSSEHPATKIRHSRRFGFTTFVSIEDEVRYQFQLGEHREMEA